jgi:hypothetical protein
LELFVGAPEVTRDTMVENHCFIDFQQLFLFKYRSFEATKVITFLLFLINYSCSPSEILKYSARRLKESLWASVKVITITK